MRKSKDQEIKELKEEVESQKAELECDYIAIRAIKKLMPEIKKNLVKSLLIYDELESLVKFYRSLTYILGATTILLFVTMLFML